MPPHPPKPTEKALWRATVDLIRLVQTRCNVEETYQRWLEGHPDVFAVLGFDRYASFEKSSGNRLPHDPERGYVPEPDFLCAQADAGALTVFELKTPFVGDPTTARADGNRQKFKATVESYISQATEYCQSIQGRLAAREVVKKALDISTISTYEICLVYGLREEWDQPSVEALLAQRKVPTHLLGFDEVLSHVVGRLAAGKPTASMPGWTCVYHISVPKTDGRRYIADMGSIVADRVSFVREGELIAFECLDSQGILHRVEALCNEGIHYVRFEFSHGGDMLYMSLHVDDEQHDLRLKNIPLRCEPDPTRIVLGASLERNKNAVVEVAEMYHVGRTLTLEERLLTHAYFLDKMGMRKYFEAEP